MASLKDTKRRIGAVRGTQKVTRAMKLVAAAKLRRAQQAAVEARAYSTGMHDLAFRVSRRLGVRAPFMWQRPRAINCVDLIAVTSDRGLCGGFNENLVRAIESGAADLADHNIAAKIFVIGRKGLRALSARGYDAEAVPAEGGDEAMISRVLGRVVRRYIDGASAGCNLAFNRFASTARQEVTFWNLVPLHKRGTPNERQLEYLCEPARESALEWLAAETLRSTMQLALLESRASEFAARMSAMDNATRNADDMIAHLTFVYNRARQEAITRELLDIVGGANALK